MKKEEIFEDPTGRILKNGELSSKSTRRINNSIENITQKITNLKQQRKLLYLDMALERVEKELNNINRQRKKLIELQKKYVNEKLDMIQQFSNNCIDGTTPTSD